MLFLVLLLAGVSTAQVGLSTFEGLDASALGTKAQLDVDPNGAIGTKQYMEWVNPVYQAYDKTTFKPIYSSWQPGDTPFRNNNMSTCYGTNGDGVVMFDHLASRWILAKRQGTGNYYYCIAISNTDDLTAPGFAWYAYNLYLNPVLGTNPQGKTYFPDYPKIATWTDAYYVTIDLEDLSQNYLEVGTLVCAFDRASMLNGSSARPPQCFRYPSAPSGLFLGHSLLAADVDGVTPPPAGTDEYLVSIQNPSGNSNFSNQINLWQFHVDWNNPANSNLSGPTPLSVATYTPGCYRAANPAATACVPEPTTASTHNYIDSVGDRLMHRFSFRQYTGTNPFSSYVFAHSVQVGANGGRQTGIRWYQFQPGSGITKYGTINPGAGNYRFMPSVAQDNAGNLAVGYSTSSGQNHPSIKASYLNLINNTLPTEFNITLGTADEEYSNHWGDYTSMTVDPVDDCTFWYVNEYYTTNQTTSTPTWQTRIANFHVSNCN
ncbi:MAG TPA: hypothetical protein VFA89_12335 [Terriglobales bacterium]|nr:hypothetical protein [Terriglobales bacterium]